MIFNPRQTTIKFLRQIGFTTGTKIWLRISWDLPTDLIPKNWNNYCRNGQFVYSHYILCGKITQRGFQLYCCTYGGRDKQGNNCWRLTPKRYADGWALAFKMSYLGATVSFYPNQPDKGISNHHVSQCQCLFYEIDDLALSEQRQAVVRLKDEINLEPAAVVYTGGKSLHVYFKCSHSLNPAEWLYLNRQLTIIQNADPAICNLARSMRLPGMVRRRVVDGILSATIPITLEHWSNCQYNVEELETAFDSTALFPYELSEQRWRKWVQLLTRAKNGEVIDPQTALLQHSITAPRPTLHCRRGTVTQATTRDNGSSLKQLRASGVSVPLSICLTLSDRTLLTYGESEGNRNNSGYKLARNLLGTSNLLTRHGIAYYPQPRQLFDRYCDRCTPTLESTEADTIWHSANKTTAFASRDFGSIVMSIRKWKLHRKSKKQCVRKPKRLINERLTKSM
ncbi:hypothetical protein HUN01_00830 (plasmid) [Nostoc edaphicum CCNP1411]|uniref:DNA primase n=1 Tax=Nostoc edaphicum CCNP1411 TaxID=1472755 RepID=A0A7D7QJL4_9NOSO|nr:hypothetical protein [Nostoc edaphicum]QMS86205.1 hypothetical protein HUN01_00830 [Nostoc edaphicum CCNP1411]